MKLEDKILTQDDIDDLRFEAKQDDLELSVRCRMNYLVFVLENIGMKYKFDIQPALQNIAEIMALIRISGGEQEPLTIHDPGAICPNCKWPLYPEDHPHYCGNCGREVKWDA